MTKTRQPRVDIKRRIDWRKLLSDLFILAGVLIFFSMMLFWVRSALAAQQNRFQPYLVSSIEFELPLPSLRPQFQATQAPIEGEPAPEATAIAPEAEVTIVLSTEAAGIPPANEILPDSTSEITSTAGVEAPAITTEITGEAFQPTPSAPTETAVSIPDENGITTTVEPVVPAPAELMYPPPVDPAAPIETEAPPVQAPLAGPVIRLVIPRLQVNRTVVPVELRRDGNGILDWNTEALFSTPNRADLVGQLAVSSNPGEGGNIILVGHNYNNGWYDWEGVFLRLQNLQAGDSITLYTENGGEFHYMVQKVKKVPWQKRNLVELEKHQKFLWPTDHEQLTLVTCGGANLWSWQARIYVVALPVTPSLP